MELIELNLYHTVPALKISEETNNKTEKKQVMSETKLKTKRKKRKDHFVTIFNQVSIMRYISVSLK